MEKARESGAATWQTLARGQQTVGVQTCFHMFTSMTGDEGAPPSPTPPPPPAFLFLLPSPWSGETAADIWAFLQVRKCLYGVCLSMRWGVGVGVWGADYTPAMF